MSIDAGGSELMAKPKSKRSRVNFKTDEFDLLEKVFFTNQYPDVGVLENLSADLKLPVEKICTWFQNRRSKFRKEAKINVQEELSFPPRGPPFALPKYQHQTPPPLLHHGGYAHFSNVPNAAGPYTTVHHFPANASYAMNNQPQRGFYGSYKTMGSTPPPPTNHRMFVFDNHADRGRHRSFPVVENAGVPGNGRHTSNDAVSSTCNVSSTSDFRFGGAGAGARTTPTAHTESIRRTRKRPFVSSSETDTGSSDFYSSPELYTTGSPAAKEPKLSSPLDDIHSLPSHIVEGGDEGEGGGGDDGEDVNKKTDFSDIVNSVFKMNSNEICAPITPALRDDARHAYVELDNLISDNMDCGAPSSGNVIPSASSQRSFKDLLTETSGFDGKSSNDLNLNLNLNSIASNYSNVYDSYNFDEYY